MGAVAAARDGSVNLDCDVSRGTAGEEVDILGVSSLVEEVVFSGPSLPEVPRPNLILLGASTAEVAGETVEGEVPVLVDGEIGGSAEFLGVVVFVVVVDVCRDASEGPTGVMPLEFLGDTGGLPCASRNFA